MDGPIMGLRDRLRSLSRRAEGQLISIPLEDGTVARFSESELAPAYLVVLERERGLDVDHPLARAARNSSDPKWRNSVWAEGEEIPEEEPEDLSES